MDEENIGVCIVLLNRTKKRVLLGRRMNSFRPGTYGLPGGRPRKNENLNDAAIREILEETGTKPDDLEYVGTVREYQEESSGNYLQFVYRCSIKEGDEQTIETNKCEKWEWYDLDKLPDQLLSPHKIALEMHTKDYRLHDLGLYIK